MRIDWSRRFNTIAFLCEKEGFWWYTACVLSDGCKSRVSPNSGSYIA